MVVEGWGRDVNAQGTFNILRLLLCYLRYLDRYPNVSRRKNCVISNV